MAEHRGDEFDVGRGEPAAAELVAQGVGDGELLLDDLLVPEAIDFGAAGVMFDEVLVFAERGDEVARGLVERRDAELRLRRLGRVAPFVHERVVGLAGAAQAPALLETAGVGELLGRRVLVRTAEPEPRLLELGRGRLVAVQAVAVRVAPGRRAARSGHARTRPDAGRERQQDGARREKPRQRLECSCF